MHMKKEKHWLSRLVKTKSIIFNRIKTSNETTHKVIPSAKFSDLGGIEPIINIIQEFIELPLKCTNLFKELGVKPPRGVLLVGPPGAGKTAIALAIGGEMNVPFFQITGPEIVSGMSGESEQKLRDLFKEVEAESPSILFIDEIDSITGKRDSANKDMERRIVAQFIACIDKLDQTDNHIIIIGATSRPESLDMALRRAGRFDKEILIGVPSEEARSCMLQSITKKLKLGNKFDYNELAKATPGYVPADLSLLVKESAIVAIKRIISQLTFSTPSFSEKMSKVSQLGIECYKDLSIIFEDFKIVYFYLGNNTHTTYL